MSYESRIPVPIHVGETEPEGKVAVDLEESSVRLVVVTDQISVRTVAEGRVRRVFAVAQLVVSAFAHVELNWPAPCHRSVTGAVAAGVRQTEPA